MEKSGIVFSDVAHNNSKLYNINIEFTSIMAIIQNMKENLFIYCTRQNLQSLFSSAKAVIYKYISIYKYIYISNSPDQF